MVRKREPKPTWRSDKSRYFSVALSSQTTKPIRDSLNAVVSDLNEVALIDFLDTDGVNQQVVLNLLILWAKRKVEEKGAKSLAKELSPVLEELERQAAESMLARGKEIDPQFIPPGTQFPAKRPKNSPE